MFSMIIQIQPSVQVIWEGFKFLYDLPKQLTYPKKIAFLILYKLEGTAGLLLAPAEGFGLRPRLFLPFGKKKKVFYAVFAYFRSFFVLSSNLSNCC